MATSPPGLTTGAFTLCLFQVTVTVTRAQNCSPGRGENGSCSSHWSRLWYVWMILLTVFILLACGVLASCLKCYRRAKSQRPTFATRPYEVSVINIENDSTISRDHSQQHILPTDRNHIPFHEPTQLAFLPPSYSFCASENPPTYEMALKMAKPPEIPEPKSRAENPSGNRPEIAQGNEGSGSAEGACGPFQ
ncbi:transmembrane protein 52-like [Narcine bancroftii]|uniref:transmembrane protein 52-like n=1 Tax=Narcine bancroftii TaxID=1343680 RepID=UPI0038313A68